MKNRVTLSWFEKLQIMMNSPMSYFGFIIFFAGMLFVSLLLGQDLYKLLSWEWWTKAMDKNLILLSVFVFPVIGLYFVVSAIRRTRKVMDVLADFELAKGKDKEVVATSTKINNRRVYKVIYTYMLAGEEMKHSVKTTMPGVLKEEVLLACSKRVPNFGVLIDRLPKSAAIRVLGNVKQSVQR